MKVPAFNCSPWMDKGNTAMILGPFLEGMKEAGADVEVLYTKRLNIQPCNGEMHCWMRKPGECIQDDDMKDVLPKLAQADVWVFATPVFFDGATGPLKNLLDRTLPLTDPFFELRDGHCRHPLHDGVKSGKVAIVSSCGLWEMDNFDPLLAHMKAVCKNVNREFAGALLRPHGPALKHANEMGLQVDDVLGAAREAGRQLIADGRMSEETLSKVSRELVPLDTYVEIFNRQFEKARQKSKHGTA